MSHALPRRVLEGTAATDETWEQVAARARVYESEGRLDEAAALLVPHAHVADCPPELLYRLACVRAKQQRLHEAEELLRRALDLRFEDARFHTNLGVVLDLQGRSEEAIRAFRRALQLSPDDPCVLLDLGALYGEIGRYDEAVRWLSRCREVNPGYESSFNLALVHLRRGDLPGAEHLFAEAVRHDPQKSVAHFYLGRCRLKLGRTQPAIAALHEALRLAPDLVQARLVLGMAHNASGRYAEAVKELEGAARALPDEARVHYQLGIAYDGLSQKARARECYRRARTIAG